MNFTISDIETLLEAMEAWENKDDAGEIMTEVVAALMMRKDAPDNGLTEQKIEEVKAKNQESKRNRKERSVLIRAKLIGLLDERRAELLVTQ